MMQGARKGISAADVVQSCDITFCCVADSVALKEVFEVLTGKRFSVHRSLQKAFHYVWSCFI